MEFVTTLHIKLIFVDDVEVVYQNQTTGDKLKVVSETIPTGKVVNDVASDEGDEDEDDEVNIDDI